MLSSTKSRNAGKNFSLLFIVFLFLQFTTLAQEGWFQQTSGTTHNLHSVYFVDNNTGWVVGDSGTILNTTDGGINWIPQTLDTMFSLYSVHFEDNNTGLAVGYDYVLYESVILKTTNGGTVWNAQLSGTWGLRSVYFTDNNTGWAVGVGGTILNTTDGGTNWNPQQSFTWMNLLSVFFIDNDTGWAVGIFQFGGGGGMIKTTDGGSNWTSQSIGDRLYSVYFTDSNTGWAVGYDDDLYAGVIRKTTDGGINWIPQTLDTMFSLYSVHFEDNNTGWTVGSNGKILNTINGGANWNPQRSDTTEGLQSVHFVDTNTGWAVGWNGTILKTITGGVIPVELTSFTASTSKGKVTLNWSTATEINNSGFEIERSEDNVSFNKIGFVQGFGTTTEPKSYSYSDQSVYSGTFYYRLKQVDYDGSYEYSDVVEVNLNVPIEYSLQQNYPNPFNPSTTIEFALPTPGFVTLSIFNILSEKVATLVSEELTAGSYKYEWDATELTSGVYFYHLRAGDFIEAKKMLLLK